MLKIKAKQYGKMMGKLRGIRSINTSPIDNPFCNKMAKNVHSICHYCYSRNMIENGYRASCRPAWKRMSELLSSDILDESEITPCLKANYIRFNAHGELFNLIHLENLIQIAKVNSHANCTLFTKRQDILTQLKQKIPDNMMVVYSNPLINSPLTEKDIPKNVNKIFNVFTLKYVLEHPEIKINCSGKRCLECKICYSKNKIKIINEIAKKWKGYIYDI